MKKDYKYIILDFGNVLAGPTTGEWFITPKFKELVDMSLVDKNEFYEVLDEYNNIISRVMHTEEEEYNSFYELYSKVLKEIGYPKYSDDIAHQIAYNFTYEDDKYEFYENIKDELKSLKEKYKLIMLTDNWPCIERILDKKGISKYFEKIYVSSYYGEIKKNGVFFDYMIDEFNINEGDALFVDDSDLNLNVGKEKGLDVVLMDRGNNIDTEFKKINNLFEILK